MTIQDLITNGGGLDQTKLKQYLTAHNYQQLLSADQSRTDDVLTLEYKDTLKLTERLYLVYHNMDKKPEGKQFVGFRDGYRRIKAKPQKEYLKTMRGTGDESTARSIIGIGDFQKEYDGAFPFDATSPFNPIQLPQSIYTYWLTQPHEKDNLANITKNWRYFSLQCTNYPTLKHTTKHFFLRKMNNEYLRAPLNAPLEEILGAMGIKWKDMIDSVMNRILSFTPLGAPTFANCLDDHFKAFMRGAPPSYGKTILYHFHTSAWDNPQLGFFPSPKKVVTFKDIDSSMIRNIVEDFLMHGTVPLSSKILAQTIDKFGIYKPDFAYPGLIQDCIRSLQGKHEVKRIIDPLMSSGTTLVGACMEVDSFIGTSLNKTVLQECQNIGKYILSKSKECDDLRPKLKNIEMAPSFDFSILDKKSTHLITTLRPNQIRKETFEKLTKIPAQSYTFVTHRDCLNMVQKAFGNKYDFVMDKTGLSKESSKSLFIIGNR